MKFFLLTLLFLTGYFFAGVASVQAKIYKCKGKDGVINFTSVPCGEKSISIKQPTKKVEFNKDGTKKSRKQMQAEKVKKEKEFLEVSKREREDKEKKRKQLEQHQNKVRENCEAAKKDLSGVQNSRIVYKKESDGQRHILSDDERKKAAAGVQRRISYWCRQ